MPRNPGQHAPSTSGQSSASGNSLDALAVRRGEHSTTSPPDRPAGANGAAVVEAGARRYADEGYVALALSLRGWPPSGGADDCALRQPDDIVAAVAWLRTLPAVLADRIALIGFSQGGQVALLTAARDPRLRAVVAYYPVTDVALWKSTTTNTDIPGYITTVCEPGGTGARSPVTRAGAITHVRRIAVGGWVERPVPRAGRATRVHRDGGSPRAAGGQRVPRQPRALVAVVSFDAAHSAPCTLLISSLAACARPSAPGQELQEPGRQRRSAHRCPRSLSGCRCTRAARSPGRSRRS